MPLANILPAVADCGRREKADTGEISRRLLPRGDVSGDASDDDDSASGMKPPMSLSRCPRKHVGEIDAGRVANPISSGLSVFSVRNTTIGILPVAASCESIGTGCLTTGMLVHVTITLVPLPVAVAVSPQVELEVSDWKLPVLQPEAVLMRWGRVSLVTKREPSVTT